MPQDDYKDGEKFGFRHHPTCIELINSPIGPNFTKNTRGYLANESELEEYEAYLKFPNIYMERLYLLYEGSKSSPIIGKEKYQEYSAKMTQLYGYIKAAEENIEEWFKWITVAENDEFIKKNVEYRLSQDMSNKKLWMIYIQYLKENNPKEMLQIYAKYCRYFPDDIDMLRKYWRATKFHGPSYVKFDELFDFEERYTEAEIIFNEIQEMQIDESKICSIFFTPNNAQNQMFSFKAPLMIYIMQNVNTTVLSKLHQTCKYFFIKIPLIPCYRFVLTDSLSHENYKYSENSMQYCSKIFPEPEDAAKNWIISTSLYANHHTGNMLSMYINKKFYQCDAKHIDIGYQRLTENEFDFLVGHGNVETCWLTSVTLYDDAGFFMPIEKILVKMPKLRDFKYAWMPLLTNKSIKKLQHLIFNSKILCFALCGINNANIINLQAFYNFIVKNAAPYSTFTIDFRWNILPAAVTNFRRNMNEIIDGQWTLKQPKPTIIVSATRPIHAPHFH